MGIRGSDHNKAGTPVETAAGARNEKSPACRATRENMLLSIRS